MKTEQIELVIRVTVFENAVYVTRTYSGRAFSKKFYRYVSLDVAENARRALNGYLEKEKITGHWVLGQLPGNGKFVAVKSAPSVIKAITINTGAWRHKFAGNNYTAFSMYVKLHSGETVNFSRGPTCHDPNNDLFDATKLLAPVFGTPATYLRMWCEEQGIELNHHITWVSREKHLENFR